MERDILGSVREGMKSAGGRGGELAEALADRVEEALEEAEARGRRHPIFKGFQKVFVEHHRFCVAFGSQFCLFFKAHPLV